jgi:hypothetical protein
MLEFFIFAAGFTFALLNVMAWHIVDDLVPFIATFVISVAVCAVHEIYLMNADKEEGEEKT